MLYTFVNVHVLYTHQHRVWAANNIAGPGPCSTARGSTGITMASGLANNVWSATTDIYCAEKIREVPLILACKYD